MAERKMVNLWGDCTVYTQYLSRRVDLCHIGQKRTKKMWLPQGRSWVDGEPLSSSTLAACLQLPAWRKKLRRERIELRQHPRGKTRDVQEVSSNSRSPKPSSAEKLYSEGLLVHPGALKHSRFGIELPQRNSGIPGWEKRPRLRKRCSG